jgi:isoprenylcysteine carboxyl methyltransferase (ICMT) family protein YpbQ
LPNIIPPDVQGKSQLVVNYLLFWKMFEVLILKISTVRVTNIFSRKKKMIQCSVIGEYRAKTAEEWISILGLACLWSFNDIRDLCIKKLGEIELDPFQKIGLQQKHNINAQWAYSSFITLCSRNEPLNIEEATVLGLEMTVKIAAVREKLEKWGRKKMEDVQKQVCDAFGLEPVK